MTKYLHTFPNLLSGLRLFLIPVLWGFALKGLAFRVGVGLVVAALTDVMDGFLARRFKWTTPFGAKLDSLADDLIIVSVFIWGFMLRPEIVTDHPRLTFVGGGVYGCSLLISLLKFRRFGSNLPLYSHKAVAIVGYLFLVHGFLFDDYHRVLYSIAMGMFILAHMEAIGIQLVSSKIDEHIGSVVFVLGKRYKAAHTEGGV